MGLPSIETAGILVAALVGAGILARYVWSTFRFFDRLNTLLRLELTHNGGSSMKDQVKATADAVERMEHTLDSHQWRIRALERLSGT